MATMIRTRLSSRKGRHLTGAALWLVVVAQVGCGSSGSSGSTTPQTGMRTAGGTAVTVAAHNYWKDGVKALEKAKQGGYKAADCAAALAAFENAVDAQPKFAEAVYMQGFTHHRCGDHKQALEFYERALRINSKLCKARAGVGLDQLERGDVSAAETTFNRAIADDPQCTEAYVNLAIIQRMRPGGNAEALKNLRRALAIDAQYLPAFNEMALLYLSEGEDNKKKLDLAEVVCSQAQKIDADYAPVYNTWGLIDLRRDKIIEASAKFQKAFQLDRRMFEAYMNFAQIALGFRGYDDAKVAFEQALKLRPSSFDALVGLGVAFRGLEQNGKAIEAYEKAQKLSPKRPEPYYNLGVLWQDFQQGTEADMSKAEGYYREFLQRAGSDRRFAEAVQDVTRKCQQKKRRGRNRNKCIAGRLQNIDNYRQALKDMAEMEKLQQQAEAEAAALEAQMKAEEEAAKAEEAAAEEPPDADEAKSAGDGAGDKRKKKRKNKKKE